jgi:hypothetical protein
MDYQQQAYTLEMIQTFSEEEMQVRPRTTHT